MDGSQAAALPWRAARPRAVACLEAQLAGPGDLVVL